MQTQERGENSTHAGEGSQGASPCTSESLTRRLKESQILSLTCRSFRRCCANNSQHTLPASCCCLAECHIIQILPLLHLLPAEEQPCV